MNTICVIGLGYIGLPTSSLFANSGFQVLGVDINQSVVEAINSGRNYIEEVGLRTLVEAAVRSGRFRAAVEAGPADAFIIAVPTPFDERKLPDLSHVFDSVKGIIPHLRHGNLVVVESTVPPGTTRRIASLIAGERPDLIDSPGVLGVTVAHCPERVLPGQILKELVENDRIIGGVTPESSTAAAALYSRIVSGKIYQTDATTAEMVKLSENTFRDVNISLANELAMVCYALDINVWEVIRLANNHPRVNILNPGPGVGGHCIAVDPWFIASTFPDTARVIRSARMRNDAMPEFVVSRILSLVQNTPQPKIACLGVSYKANVGDPRNSPALAVYRSLVSSLPAGAVVQVTDPHVSPTTIPLKSLDEVLSGANLVVILTDHDEYKSLDAATVSSLVRSKCVFDTRNALDHHSWRAAGFQVHTI